MVCIPSVANLEGEKSVQLKLIREIGYWILFAMASLIVIMLLTGCRLVTLDDYVNFHKGYVYEGNMYYPTDIFTEKEKEK